MPTTKINLLNGLDRIVAATLAAILVGSALGFGGAVWWGRPAVVALTLAATLAWLARVAVVGRWRMLKSPLGLLGALALSLGLVQLLPVPASLVERVSPRSVAVNSFGVIPERATADDPSLTMPDPFLARCPITLDRPATLRWLVGATACLALFWVASHYSDRLRHAQVIWGSVVAAFFVNAVLASVQVANRSEGLYGCIQPGTGPAFAPTLDDALEATSATVLRPVGEEPKPGRPALAAARPDRPFLVGTLMGGPGAFLALGSLALPLAFGLFLQTMAPRGSREGLLARLKDSGQGSQVALMSGLLVAGSVLVGIMAGPWPSVPFGLALAAVGLPGTWSSGLRKTGLAASAVLLVALGVGVFLGNPAGEGDTFRVGLPRIDRAGAKRTWAESASILKDFPIAGIGFGTFATIHPYYKGRDGAQGTAMSSLLQWVVESGAIGLALMGMAGLWCLVKLPGAIARVGSADRALAFGLVGSLGCFVGFSAIHWTVELAAVALAASAIAGTGNRWLAGGTDLFVDRG